MLIWWFCWFYRFGVRGTVFVVDVRQVLVKFGVSGEFSLVDMGFWNFAAFTVLILFSACSVLEFSILDVFWVV